MHKIICVYSVLSCLLVSCAVTEKLQTGKQEGDWFESPRDRKIDLPESAFVWGNYTAEILRRYTGETELKLLRIAESVYPPRERVLEVKVGDPFKSPQDVQGNEPLWWYASFEGIRIPYAITTSAVRYYSDLVRAFRDQDFTATNGVAISQCLMRYTGAISHHRWFTVGGQSFPECYVASMEFTWTQQSGDGELMRFVKKRVVILDPKGQVLGVFLDGPTDVQVG